MIAPVVMLLLSSLQLFVTTVESATCIPDYFQYVSIRENVYIGRINIPSPPKDVPLQLSVTLSLAAVLPTAYVGRLELTESRAQSVKSVQQGGPLKYTIRFPLPYPLPNVNQILFNDVRICSDQRATGQIITSIVLNHTLYPPGVSLLTVDDRNTIPDLQSIEEVPSQTFPPLTNEKPPELVPMITRPSIPPSPPVSPTPSVPISPFLPSVPTNPFRPPPPNVQIPQQQCESRPISKVRDFETEMQCGRKDERTTFLVAGGIKTKRGEWPWLAALFVVLTEYKFQCGGSLITNTHVITAAHCMWHGSVMIPTGGMEVSLGRYHLKDFREKGSVSRSLSNYIVHPDYLQQMSLGSASADADMAILTLRERVEYSIVIKPICLWASCISLTTVIGLSGTVVGWGRDEFGNLYTEEPRMVQVPIVSLLECHWNVKTYVYITSNRTFCAGSRDQTGPCNGDSGSGMVLRNDKDNRYYLRGIVSLSYLNSTTNSCDLDKYVVFTDVAKHLDWIYQKITT